MTNEPVDVTAVSFVHDTIVDLEFDDGTKKRIDLRSLMQGPVFDSVFESNAFHQVVASQEEGTLVWPNGASLDSFLLRYLTSGQILNPAC